MRQDELTDVASEPVPHSPRHDSDSYIQPTPGLSAAQQTLPASIPSTPAAPSKPSTGASFCLLVYAYRFSCQCLEGNAPMPWGTAPVPSLPAQTVPSLQSSHIAEVQAWHQAPVMCQLCLFARRGVCAVDAGQPSAFSSCLQSAAAAVTRPVLPAGSRSHSGHTASTQGTLASGQSILPDLPWSDWELKPEDLQICSRPDGSRWHLGSGAYGSVYKGLLDGVQVGHSLL